MTRIASRSLLLALLLSGCGGIGPARLDVDQLGYVTAIGEGLKRQMLLNMVRLRYADVPAFLSVSQLISGYTMQSTAQAGLNAYPNANPGNFATLSGTVQYTDRPTFTFTPITGDQFAQSYLRPLSPTELLSLAQSGAPIDLLFRLGVHSVNGLGNGANRAGEARQASDGFQALMRALLDIQAAGALGLRFERHAGVTRVFLLLDGTDPRVRPRVQDARRLLGVRPGSGELEVVYGRGRTGQDQVAVLTRGILQVLFELGAHLDVAEADVRRGETVATDVGTMDPRDRLIRIHQGQAAPPDAFAAVVYRGRWFWIESGDFRSKTTFTFVYILQVLAEGGRSQATPIVTIPVQ